MTAYSGISRSVSSMRGVSSVYLLTFVIVSDIISNFTLAEFLRSDMAARNHIDNTPSWDVVRNLEHLVLNVLQPLRDAWGKPIIVTSGYRCPLLNKAVGGVVNSQHMTGQAADIVPQGRNPADIRRLFQMVQKLNLPFDQLINEHNFSWVHVSWSATPRHQVLNIY